MQLKNVAVTHFSYYFRGELPLERATSREKGQPLCMEQFYRLLGVCRIPEVGKDRLELPAVKSGTEEQEELVVVACRNYVSALVDRTCKPI